MKNQNNHTNILALDLGCGKRKRPGAIGVDYSARHNPDVIHDLNVFPYPFESESFDEVYLDNVLEHLDSPIRVMEEVHRITKSAGKVQIIVPYFRSVWAFIDPTHKTFYSVNSFAYFDPSHPICARYDYTSVRFSVEKVIFNETLINGWFKKIMVRLANKFPNGYEAFISHIYPLDDISYYLLKC